MNRFLVSRWPIGILVGVLLGMFPLKFGQVSREHVLALRAAAGGPAVGIEPAINAERIREAMINARTKPSGDGRWWPYSAGLSDHERSQLTAVMVSHKHLRPSRILFHTLKRRLDDPSFYVLLSATAAAALVSRGLRRARVVPLPPYPHWTSWASWSLFCAIGSIYLFTVYSNGEAFFYVDGDSTIHAVDPVIRIVQSLEGAAVVIGIAVTCAYFGPAVWAPWGWRKVLADGTHRAELAEPASLFASCIVGPLLFFLLFLSVILYLVVPGLLPQVVLQRSHWSSRLPQLALYCLPFLAISVSTCLALWRTDGYRFRIRRREWIPQWIAFALIGGTVVASLLSATGTMILWVNVALLTAWATIIPEWFVPLEAYGLPDEPNRAASDPRQPTGGLCL